MGTIAGTALFLATIGTILCCSGRGAQERRRLTFRDVRVTIELKGASEDEINAKHELTIWPFGGALHFYTTGDCKVGRSISMTTRVGRITDLTPLKTDSNGTPSKWKVRVKTETAAGSPFRCAQYGEKEDDL